MKGVESKVEMIGHAEIWEREWAQDGEYTGPGDNPPGYAGDWYRTLQVVAWDEEHTAYRPVADCYEEADADKIAATLDLLAACKMLERTVNESVSGVREVSLLEWTELLRQAQAAIAKAEPDKPNKANTVNTLSEGEPA